MVDFKDSKKRLQAQGVDASSEENLEGALFASLSVARGQKRKVHTIYLLTCKVTGKSYVGQTVDFASRWRQHIFKNSECTYLRNAIQKYGPQNFVKKMLQTCVGQEEANKLEGEWIAKLKTVAPYGYNLMAGGNVRRHHDDTKWLMRKKSNTSQWKKTARKNILAFHASLTLSQRSDRMRKIFELKTPAQKMEWRHKIEASLTIAQRRKRIQLASKIRASMTPAQRSESMRKAWITRRAKLALMSHDQRSARGSEHARKIRASTTPAQRSERSRKAALTLKARQALRTK